MNCENLTLTKAKDLLKKGEITSVDLVKYYLGRIKEFNPQYNVFLNIRDEKILIEEANKSDEERKIGNNKKLLGIPFCIKDSFMAKDTVTTAGDKYLKDTKSEYDSVVIKKLLDEGAILLGKVNMDAWGFGSSTENSSYGITRNPHNKEYVAGGSSGGAAASVALDMCIFSIGEDTGGSIRNPANYCGVFGLKPTYGRVSRFGCIAYASSLDTIGPICKSAEDVGIIFDIINKSDSNDLSYSEYNVGEFMIRKKFAYSFDFIPEEINEDVVKTYKEGIKFFEENGFEAVEIKLPNLKYYIPTYYITAMSEASTNLSRYNGTRYGNFHNTKNIDGLSWEELYTQSRTEGLNDEAKRRCLLGAYMLSEGYYDAYYKKAQKVRNLISSDINNILKDVDFILSPITPTPAPKIGQHNDNPILDYLGDIYTVTANLAGIPSLAFPFAKSKDNLPIGLQIMGKKGDDEKLIKIISNLNLV